MLRHSGQIMLDGLAVEATTAALFDPSLTLWYFYWPREAIFSIHVTTITDLVQACKPSLRAA